MSRVVRPGGAAVWFGQGEQLVAGGVGVRGQRAQVVVGADDVVDEAVVSVVAVRVVGGGDLPALVFDG